MFFGWKNQYCENDYTTQNNLRLFNSQGFNLYQITNGTFHRTRTKKKFKIFMETRKTLNSQRKLLKEKQRWKNQSS